MNWRGPNSAPSLDQKTQTSPMRASNLTTNTQRRKCRTHFTERIFNKMGNTAIVGEYASPSRSPGFMERSLMFLPSALSRDYSARISLSIQCSTSVPHTVRFPALPRAGMRARFAIAMCSVPLTVFVATKRCVSEKCSDRVAEESGETERVTDGDRRGDERGGREAVRDGCAEAETVAGRLAGIVSAGD
jgi:hypothetical protein